MIQTANVTLNKGRCNIYCVTGPVQNHFWNQKKSRPGRHKSTKIIGPCQYAYEKSVGPVDAIRSLPYPDVVWEHCKPSSPPARGSKAGVWWGYRGKVPRSSKVLAFFTTKMVKNNKIADDRTRTCNPSVINQVLYSLS